MSNSQSTGFARELFSPLQFHVFVSYRYCQIESIGELVSLLKSQNRFLLLLMLSSAFVRGGVLIGQQEHLDNDIDAYLGIAAQIAAGKGFSVPNSTPPQPTAFRPPLYPLLLAIVRNDVGRLGIGLLHLALGLGTVWFTWQMGLRLGSESAARWAACLVAFDPLLLQYSTQPMTETLCAFLAAWVLSLMVPIPESKARQLGLGLLLGICVLSRPTFLGFGLVFVLGWLIQSRRTKPAATGSWLTLLGILIGVSPWVIRNALVFGEFRVTTTHGGYTLLLGNNPVFYDEVVQAPWGTTWEGESLARWQASLETEIKHTEPEVKTEAERDRWFARQAHECIVENPSLFLKACGLRFLRFWNVFPPESARESIAYLWRKSCGWLRFSSGESAAETVARIVAAMVAIFYMILIGSFALGMFRLRREEWSQWWPLLLLIASFCAVHLIYWTNARMRAPVMPAVVLFAVRAWLAPSNK